MNLNSNYCDDYFTVYSNIKLLCCLPEINIMYADYISIKKYIKVIKDVDNLFPTISD